MAIRRLVDFFSQNKKKRKMNSYCIGLSTVILSNDRNQTWLLSWPIKICKSHGIGVDEWADDGPFFFASIERLWSTINLKRKIVSISEGWLSPSLPISANDAKGASLIINFLNDFIVDETSTFHAMIMKC